jgi:DNA repair protein RecO (recombination protein O)
MAIYYKSQGLFVNKIDRGEADQIFKIYTKDFGKLSILAKAVRKTKSKLRGGADFLYLSDIEFIQGRNQKTLTDANLVENFPGIKSSFKKMETACNISKVVDMLTGLEENDKKIWYLLKGALSEMEKTEEEKLDILYCYFLWNFFSLIGYLPELYRCSACNKKIIPGVLHFSPSEGGMICWQCSLPAVDSFQIDQDLIKVLRVALSNNWNAFCRIKMDNRLKKSFKKISQDYLKEVLGKVDNISPSLV